ncbi:DUF6538 domain-containing protein, partial [Escherichia coli]|uniref:DUF6538 domain-containing protein n=2 Tax=Enterobacteriaceae TaxID=543 RepID=UPI00135FDFEA
MVYKRDRYLVLDPCGNYLVRIAIPKYMSHLFGGKRYFMKSTGTRDVREARLFRDAVALEWVRLRNLMKPEKSSAVESIIDELRRVSMYAKEAPLQYIAPAQACPSLLKMRD